MHIQALWAALFTGDHFAAIEPSFYKPSKWTNDNSRTI